MKLSKLWLVAGFPLVFAACAGEEAEVAEEPLAEGPVAVAVPVTPPTNMPMDTGMAGATMPAGGNTVQLMAVNQSDHTGEATLTTMGEQTQVMVQLTGPTDRTHPGHIHTGTCDNPGPVVVPLEEITTADGTGMATATVDVPIATVMNGQHIVQYHDPAGGQPIACGNIPQMTGAAM